MEKPEGYPDIVYKYRTWSNPLHQRVLTHNELFLAAPRDFNDPFDCRIPANYVSLNTPEKIEKFVTKSASTHNQLSQKDGRDLNQLKKKLEDEMMQDIWKFQNKYEKGWFKYREDYLGVLSLSARWDSTLMWSHYADYHKGFCIGFFEEKIRNSNFFARGGLVAYNPEDEFPFIDPMDDDRMTRAFTETHTKAYDWAYEREYRAVKTFREGNQSVKDRTITISDDFFAELILGLNISPEHKDNIIKVCQAKGIKVFQAEKVPFQFKIKRFEVLPIEQI